MATTVLFFIKKRNTVKFEVKKLHLDPDLNLNFSDPPHQSVPVSFSCQERCLIRFPRCIQKNVLICFVIGFISNKIIKLKSLSSCTYCIEELRIFCKVPLQNLCYFCCSPLFLCFPKLFLSFLFNMFKLESKTCYLSYANTDGLFLASSASVMPINDIRGIDAMMYAKGEKQLR